MCLEGNIHSQAGHKRIPDPDYVPDELQKSDRYGDYLARSRGEPRRASQAQRGHASLIQFNRMGEQLAAARSLLLPFFRWSGSLSALVATSLSLSPLSLLPWHSQ